MRRNYSYKYKPRSVRKLERKAKKGLITTIVISIVLIFVLLNWGIPALIGSLSVFNKFKTNPPKQVNTEGNAAIAPPVLSIPYEATNTAKINISGYSQPNSKVEIYIDDELQDTVLVTGDGSFTSYDIELRLGTNNIYGKTINDQDKKSLSSKNIKILFSDEKPLLEISEPEDNKEIKGGDKKVRVSGRSAFENSVTVNGSTVIVNSEGNFTTEIPINEGDNIITIMATDQYGNSENAERKVKYSP